jgi:hypothetical protein
VAGVTQQIDEIIGKKSLSLSACLRRMFAPLAASVRCSR